jgi:hypothetical protein
LDALFAGTHDSYSFRRSKTLENGRNICDFHNKQGTEIYQRELDENEALEDSDDEDNFQNHFFTNKHEELLNNKMRPMYPVILPRSLIVCCAGKYCVNECSLTIFSETVHENNQSKFIVCSLCRNIVCSQECISTYKYCLKCTDMHLCSNGRKCVECTDVLNHPGWLLGKKIPLMDPTTGITGYSTYVYEGKTCFECDNTICINCSVKCSSNNNGNKIKCAYCEGHEHKERSKSTCQPCSEILFVWLCLVVTHYFFLLLICFPHFFKH